MLRELKQIFQEDVTHSINFEKRMQKSSSVSEITLSHIRRTERLSQVNEDTLMPSALGRSQVSQESNQFIFCLKLKMIGITRLLENSELDSQKIQSKDANQILSELTKKIKAFQKQSARKFNQQQNKNKKLEIQIISLNSKIKTLESDISHLKRQQDKSSKTNTIDVKKLQSKIKDHENQKQTIQLRLRSTTQIADEQTKIISQLQAKIGEFSKNKKVLQNFVFEKEKEIAQLVNEHQFQKLRQSQESQNLKKSLLKKSQQINRLSNEVRSLKQIIDNKQYKIDQLRKKYNKIYGDLQKSQSKTNMLQEQLSKKEEEFHKAQQNCEKIEDNFKVLKEKNLKIAAQISQFEQKFVSTLNSLQSLLHQIKGMKEYQGNVVAEINFFGQRMDNLIENLENKYIAQEQLLRQQFRIEIENVIVDIEIYYQRLLGNLQDELFNLKLQQKKHLTSKQ